MTEAAKTAENAAETTIEIVKEIPLGVILLAMAIGGTVVFFAMLALSKAPQSNPAAE